MKDQTRRNKLAALLGIETPTAPTANRPSIAAENSSREAEAVIAWAEDPKKFKRVQCRHCEGTFYVNRANVACCSDRCRAAELAKIGIEWNWHKPPQERWAVSQGSDRTAEPFVIPAALVAVLKTYIEETSSIPTL